jgi:hypothetical protein
MNGSSGDPFGGPVRRLAAHYLTSSLLGLTFPMWCKLLAENRFAIHPMYLPRALAITGSSLINSLLGLASVLVPDRTPAGPLRAPVFVLGHWRSGTSYLQELIWHTGPFISPTMYQVMNPSTFRLTQRVMGPLFDHLLPETRIIDAMKVSSGSPQEEEFAIAQTCGLSPYLAYSFPRSWARYDASLDFADCPDRVGRQWLVELDRILRRVMGDRAGVPLLKSPASTARLRLLQAGYPNARYVHVSRHPYEIFASTREMLRRSIPLTQLQPFREADLDDIIIGRLDAMYRAYFRDADQMDRAAFHHVRYEDLVRRPREVLGHVTDFLGQGNLSDPRLDAYLARTAEHPSARRGALAPDLRVRLNRAWAIYFDRFGYTPDPAA